MFAGLESRTPCFACGYWHRVIQCCDIRINRSSLVVTGPSLVSVGRRLCPECGAPNAGEFIPITPWRLVPKDAAKVIEYRRKRWGISDAPGLMAERWRVAS
jgi:hypothetical protein